jgi:hypothetical protein
MIDFYPLLYFCHYCPLSYKWIFNVLLPTFFRPQMLHPRCFFLSIHILLFFFPFCLSSQMLHMLWVQFLNGEKKKKRMCALLVEKKCVLTRKERMKNTTIILPSGKKSEACTVVAFTHFGYFVCLNSWRERESGAATIFQSSFLFSSSFLTLVILTVYF